MGVQRAFATRGTLRPAETIGELNDAQVGIASVGAEADHPRDRHPAVGHLVLAVNGIRLKSPRDPKYALCDKNRFLESLILVTARTARNH